LIRRLRKTALRAAAADTSPAAPRGLLRLLATAVAFLGALPAQAQTRCGVERWPVKIAADNDVARVDTIPIPTTVAELTRVRRPNAEFAYRTRVGPIEHQTFLLRARLARVIAEDDSDLHLVLRDLEIDSLTLVAEIPSPGCTADPRLAEAFATARQALRGSPRDGILEIVGIGFFDFLHGQSGMARNGLEIHPVLSLRVIKP
jgi:hypothetical protein